MPTPVFTSRTFDEVASHRPWNAIFFHDDVLSEVVRDCSERFSSFDRASAMAELAIRYFLSRDERYRLVLESAIDPDHLRDFLDLCSLCTQGKARIEDLRKPLADCKDDVLAERLCFRFHRLLSADGVIPVFAGAQGNGFLIPFSFIGSVAPDSTPKVFDADDCPVKAWSDAMLHLPEPIDANVRVDAHFGFSSGWAPPVGNSLLLPVLAAWWRREGRLPPYDPLRLLFTGSFRGGAAECVETNAKKEKVNACVKDGVLFHPVPANAVLGDSAVREGSSASETFRAIRAKAEEVADAAPNYALQRLGDFESEVRQDRFENWPAMLRRLDRLRANLDPDLDEDAWLSSLMLMSSAYCHSGDTSLAEEWSARAIAFAEGHSEAGLLRALVERLVILQDMEDVDGVLALAPNLEERIDRLLDGPAGPDGVSADSTDVAVDHAMRYHGTMGQFHAYAAISGIRPDICSSESAVRHIETAFACAKELHRRASGTERELQRAKDVAQDANYKVLCAALFDRNSLDDALARAVRLSLRCGAAVEKNALFARRYHAFGLYRAVLEGCVVSRAKLSPHLDFIKKPDGTWWAPATTAKYLGAVLASSAAPGGAEAEKARQLFQVAADGLPLDSTGVFRKIAMTVRAEAFRSLRDFFPKDAARYLSEAKVLVEGIPDTGGRWCAWLDAPDSAPFPGLSYWY